MTAAELGVGCVVGKFAWRDPRAAVPVGVVIDHGDHAMLVSWANLGGGVPPLALFTLDSLRPLTVVETVECSGCSKSGWIRDGAWVPEEVVQRG